MVEGVPESISAPRARAKRGPGFDSGSVWHPLAPSCARLRRCRSRRKGKRSPDPGFLAVALAEPSTLATDYLLGGFAAVLGVRLWRAGADAGRRSVRFWAAALLAAAVAAVAGGTWHGFHPYIASGVGRALWKLTLLALGTGSYFMLAGSAFATLRGAVRRTVLVLGGAKLLVYCFWLAGHEGFSGAVLDYGTAMLAVLALHGWAWHRRREPASPWMAAGVGVSALAAAIQGSGIVLHRHFNANDVYHLVQMAALFLFHRGAMKMEDAAGRAAAIIPGPASG
jgi:hypothetical protein